MCKDENKIAFLLLSVYYVAMVAMALIANGTGDDGDSIASLVLKKGYSFNSLLSDKNKTKGWHGATPFD